MPLKGAEREHFLSIRKFSFKKANTIFSLGISFWWLKIAQIFPPLPTQQPPDWPQVDPIDPHNILSPEPERPESNAAVVYLHQPTKTTRQGALAWANLQKAAWQWKISTKIPLFLDVFPLQNPWVSLFHCHIYLCSLKSYANQKKTWHAPFKRLAVRMIYEYLECII